MVDVVAAVIGGGDGGGAADDGSDLKVGKGFGSESSVASRPCRNTFWNLCVPVLLFKLIIASRFFLFGTLLIVFKTRLFILVFFLFSDIASKALENQNQNVSLEGI